MLEVNIDMSEIEALAGQFGQVAERMPVWCPRL
jgi:hypothetical protein